MLCVGCDKNSYSEKQLIFWSEDCFKTEKSVTRKGTQVKQDFHNFFTTTITFLEPNFDFTSSNYLCALKPFSLRKNGLTYSDIQCASECLKMMDILDI